MTGGRGFVGSHLVDALVARGDDVLVLDNEASGDNWNEGARYVHHDLTYSTPEFGPEPTDVVFHCAAVGRTPEAMARPLHCWNLNVMGSVRLLEACRRLEVSRVVLSSSNIVYGAETPYKASKLAMEQAAKVYADLYGLSTICLRYGNTYGPRQREDGFEPNVFPALRKSLREDGFARISGNGEQTRDFVHVSDVVQANLLAAESDQTGEYDICTGRSTSLNEIVRLLKCPLQYGPEREGDVKHIKQDPAPADVDLGFKSTVVLEDGIKDSFPEAVPA